MLERFAVLLAVAIVEQFARRARAHDADDDRQHLAIAASNLREWLRRNRAGKAR